MKRTATIIVAVVLASLVRVGAQEPVPEPVDPPVYEDEPWGILMPGLKYDSVLGPTASGCLLWKVNHPGRRSCSHDFWIVQLEAGEGGGKLQCGYGQWFIGGAAVRVSLMQTWDEPIDVEPGQTYLGWELQAALGMMTAHFGAYGRVNGDGGEDDEALLIWGVGLGL